MEIIQTPYLKSLSHRGYIQGVSLSSKSTNTLLCHFFGGLRYALPPPQRWRKARPLPPSYSYGTKDHPGYCPGAAGVCPQPNFMDLSVSEGWDEDCFQCNVWVPVGEPPDDDGGFLQFGTPNFFSAAALLGETDFNAIVVMPAYRVGVFGFLYSSEIETDAALVGETVGNHGFWDQRMALEWTKENIGLFGGNGSQITLSGYSAGAYSVCYQLAYDLQLPDTQALVKRACIWSNSPAAQPKSPAATQAQFNELLSALKIPISLPDAEKLARLRAIPASTLLSAATSIEINQFRPTSDSLIARKVRLILGECRDEHFLYATWYPPQNDLASLRRRLLADYPRHVVDPLVKCYYSDGRLPGNCENWSPDAWGRIYADMQVHKMQRGLVQSLASHGATDLLYRYRIEYRLKCADKSTPPSWGVTHATDQYIWFWGNGEVVEPHEKPIIKRALIDPFIRFVHGEEDLNWGTTNHREIRTLKPDGSVEIWHDGLWDDAMHVWKTLREAAEFDDAGASRL
ncbi:hypothetical protein ARAM_007004 [Aspergillus rambellii]|uniref:Carboxylic ester hydrolase n=1 Tax=Aspergillus rambellii TaxID=308745 RepID=A0A0F8X902_9EURO|nr:hypothetical protein ARAM_007004 [Aspergillus rambellii]